jgi:hypothetical protein
MPPIKIAKNTQPVHAVVFRPLKKLQVKTAEKTITYSAVISEGAQTRVSKAYR